MAFTYRCDYCGIKLSVEYAERCPDCDSVRIVDLRTNQKGVLYKLDSRFGSQEELPVEEVEEEPKKAKKQSKDLKNKRTKPTYAEQVKMRYNYKYKS
jgi:DNA-directed RNA polymerase subunit RPC12/RpoP